MLCLNSPVGDGTPYTLDFAKCRTAKWSGKTAWGFNPRWGVPFNTPFPP